MQIKSGHPSPFQWQYAVVIEVDNDQCQYQKKLRPLSIIPEKDLEILIIPSRNDSQTKKKPVEKQALFEQLCGLWENRDDISLETIRNKAWKRKKEPGQ